MCKILNSFSATRESVSHLIVEAAGCVEGHGGIESARAYNAAVFMVTGDVHELRRRVSLHLTAHVQL